MGGGDAGDNVKKLGTAADADWLIDEVARAADFDSRIVRQRIPAATGSETKCFTDAIEDRYVTSGEASNLSVCGWSDAFAQAMFRGNLLEKSIASLSSGIFSAGHFGGLSRGYLGDAGVDSRPADESTKPKDREKMIARLARIGEANPSVAPRIAKVLLIAAANAEMTGFAGDGLKRLRGENVVEELDQALRNTTNLNVRRAALGAARGMGAATLPMLKREFNVAVQLFTRDSQMDAGRGATEIVEFAKALFAAMGEAGRDDPDVKKKIQGVASNGTYDGEVRAAAFATWKTLSGSTPFDTVKFCEIVLNNAGGKLLTEINSTLPLHSQILISIATGKNHDIEMRRWALSRLSWDGYDVSRGIDQLDSLVRDSSNDMSLREGAARIIAEKHHDRASGLLAWAVDHRHDDISAPMMGALERKKLCPPSAVAAVSKAAQIPSGVPITIELKASAIKVLSYSSPLTANARGIILKGVGDQNKSVSMAALGAIGNFEPRRKNEASGAVLALFDRSDVQMDVEWAGAAIKAMGRIGDRKQLDKAIATVRAHIPGNTSLETAINEAKLNLQFAAVRRGRRK